MTEEKHKIIAIVPARYGSTRFPGKLLRPILGVSLIQRTYENTLKSKLLDKVIVATDDQRIFDHVKTFTSDVLMTSKDCVTGTDRLVEAIGSLDLAANTIVVNVQGDEPCLSQDVLTSVIEILENNPEAVLSTAVVKLKSFEEAQASSLVKCVIDQHSNALYFSRVPIPFCQKLGKQKDIQYYGHLGIYAYRCHFLKCYGKLEPTPLQRAEDLEQLKVLEHGYSIKVAIVNDLALGVDLPEDISKVESQLCKQNTFS